MVFGGTILKFSHTCSWTGWSLNSSGIAMIKWGTKLFWPTKIFWVEIMFIKINQVYPYWSNTWQWQTLSTGTEFLSTTDEWYLLHVNFLVFSLWQPTSQKSSCRSVELVTAAWPSTAAAAAAAGLLRNWCGRLSAATSVRLPFTEETQSSAEGAVW